MQLLIYARRGSPGLLPFLRLVRPVWLFGRNNGRRRGAARAARRNGETRTALDAAEIAAARATPLPHTLPRCAPAPRTLRPGWESREVENEPPESSRLPPECDDGNVEYKLRLKDPHPLRFQQLVRKLVETGMYCTSVLDSYS